MDALGESVRKARLNAGFTARELARHLSLSHSYVSQLETGGIAQPSPRVLRKLSETLATLDYRRLLVAARYLSRVDELGDEDRERDASVAPALPASGAKGVRVNGAGLVPHRNPELAERLLAAIIGRDDRARDGARRARRVPLLCAIPAGSAPTAQVSADDALETVAMPPGVRGVGPFAALRVVGDSMADAGILEGDVVIVDRGARARDGDVCAVCIEGEHPTLKSVYSSGDTVVLAPSNRSYAPIIVNMAEIDAKVRIFGRVVHVYRNC